MTKSFCPCQQSIVRLDNLHLEVVLASFRTSNPFLSRFKADVQAALTSLLLALKRLHGFLEVTAAQIWDSEDVHDLGSVETEFLAIAFNDMLTSEATLSCEPTGDEQITTWEELVEKFFCRLYPESYDGEDEMFDEGENGGLIHLNSYQTYVDNIILSNNELKGSKYENPPNTATDSFFKAYEARDIEKQSQTKRKYKTTIMMMSNLTREGAKQKSLKLFSTRLDPMKNILL
ncbi:hypothetical protein Tco_0901551 [Tanacetum coccineum]